MRSLALAHALHVLVAAVFVGLVVVWSVAGLTSSAGWRAVGGYWRMLAVGWLVTLGIAAAALGLSLVTGLVLALARRSSLLPVRALATVYVEIVRGTPLLVQILILFYGVFDRVGLENRYVAGVLILSGFSGAYVSEIIRAGIESVGRSQLDSARAIGLTPVQTYRFVIFPQALRRILPPLAGQAASLIKDSSLLSIVGIAEFTLGAQQVNAFTYSTLESYLPLAIGYLILTLPVSLWTQALERRHQFET